MEEHRSANPKGDRWGFKNPRAMLLLPFLDAKFPEMKFIHVVRDGRDMAFSSNRIELELHGSALLEDLQRQVSPPEQAMLMWSAANLQVANYGAKMGKRYLRLQFEKLCHQPETTVAEIFGFLGVADRDPNQAVAEIVPSESLGRWKHQDESILQSITSYGRDALQRFGYIP